MEVNRDYFRPITHHKYKYKNKLGDKGKQSWLKKNIFEKPGETVVKSVGAKSKYLLFLNHQYMSMYCHPKMGSRIGGGAMLIIVLGIIPLFFKENYEFSDTDYFLFGAALLLLIFFLVYYFTMPKKELILNRIDGTITFSGWTWNKNSTMPFSEVKFTMDKNALLHAVRPDFIGSIQIVNMGKGGWHVDMSFITWFMDKNRPLPPGDAFDAYREIDFERRKADGFPPALYPGFVSTPEATPEQQAERDKYWKENIEYFQREHNSRWYDPILDKDWKKAKYGIGKGLRTPMSKECIKYTFEDGSIVYAKTNLKGEVPEPPTTIKFTTNKVEVVKNLYGSKKEFAEQ